MATTKKSLTDNTVSSKTAKTKSHPAGAEKPVAGAKMRSTMRMTKPLLTGGSGAGKG